MDASTLPEINVGVVERVTSTAYLLSVVLVFLFCLAFMWGVFVRPTWNAQTDEDKRKWKTFWNRIEIIWLISAFSTIIFALSPGSSYFEVIGLGKSGTNLYHGILQPGRCTVRSPILAIKSRRKKRWNGA
jgi:hypothetical protein